MNLTSAMEDWYMTASIYLFEKYPQRLMEFNKTYYVM